MTLTIGSIQQLIREPIPQLPNSAGWRNRPVQVALHDEALVELSERQFKAVRFRPYYYENGLNGSTPKFYARQGVLEKLLAADQVAYDLGNTWVFYDFWRSEELQAALFDDRKETMRQEWLHIRKPFTEEELTLAAQTHVSLPSDDPIKPSPHLTGGAADLVLGNAHGEELPLGIFDLFDTPSSTRHFEEKLSNGGLQPSEEVALMGRRRQYWILDSVGFKNYPEEWWHGGFGDALTAATYGVPVHYGPVWPSGWQRTWKAKNLMGSRGGN